MPKLLNGPFYDLHALDNWRLKGAIVLWIARGIHDLIHRIHPGQHAPKSRILPIEAWVLLHHDEKLTSRAVGIVGSSHAQDAPLMLHVVELCLDPILWTSRAPCAGITRLRVRISALDHETRDYPVKLRPIVESLASKFLEVGHMVRGFVREEHKDYPSLRSLHHGDLFPVLRHTGLRVILRWRRNALHSERDSESDQ